METVRAPTLQETGGTTTRVKQVEFLYRHLTIALVATAVNSIVLVFVLWSKISHSRLIAWLALSALVVVARYTLLLCYRKSGSPLAVGRWGQRFLAGTTLSGICWGSAGIFMFPTDSIPHQAFLAFVLGGMATGAVPTYSVSMSVFLAFAVPALVPITTRFFGMGDELHLAMGGMAILFILLMIDSARRVHKTIEKSLDLEVTNQALILSLTAARDELEERVEDRTAELREALSKVKVLSGLLPICSSCKKIRDDQGYWNQMELYIREHSEAEFTHSLCPECAQRLFPSFGDTD